MNENFEKLKTELNAQGALPNDGDLLTETKLLALNNIAIDQLVEQGKITETEIEKLRQLDGDWNSPPIAKLSDTMGNIEIFLTIAGLTNDTVRQAKIVCPDKIEKTVCLLAEIDKEFLNLGLKLKNLEIWNNFVATKILPYFLAYCDVILAVNGAIKIDTELIADRIKLVSCQ